MLAERRCIAPAAPAVCCSLRRCALPNSSPAVVQLPRLTLGTDSRVPHAKPQRLARRDATATMQATAENYTADVPVAGQKVLSLFFLHIDQYHHDNDEWGRC